MIPALNKTYDDLTDKQTKYVDNYLKTGTRNEAYRLAGFSIEGRGWKAQARKLFFQLQKIIQERIELKFGQGAILAMNIVQEIMQDDKVSAAVRLNAAKDFLSRAGYDRPLESRVQVTDKRSKEEIDRELADMIEGANADKPGAVSQAKH